MTPFETALLLGAGLIGGAINSIAGGGSLVTFPIAIATGLSPLTANATNTVALTPGALASAWGYRREVEQDRAIVKLFAIPAVFGGAAGAVLLMKTPPSVFEAVVPFLVLGATGLLLFQNLRKAPKPAPNADPLAAWALPKSKALVVGLQFLIAVYGGYFGAGIGILTLAVLALLGGRDIHRMNGVKTLISGITNGIAAIGFIAARVFDVRTALLLMAGATAGGYVGARLARKANPRVIRWLVVAIGVTLSAILARRRWA